MYHSRCPKGHHGRRSIQLRLRHSPAANLSCHVLSTQYSVHSNYCAYLGRSLPACREHRSLPNLSNLAIANAVPRGSSNVRWLSDHIRSSFAWGKIPAESDCSGLMNWDSSMEDCAGVSPGQSAFRSGHGILRPAHRRLRYVHSTHLITNASCGRSICLPSSFN